MSQLTVTTSSARIAGLLHDLVGSVITHLYCPGTGVAMLSIGQSTWVTPSRVDRATGLLITSTEDPSRLRTSASYALGMMPPVSGDGISSRWAFDFLLVFFEIWTRGDWSKFRKMNRSLRGSRLLNDPRFTVQSFLRLVEG